MTCNLIRRESQIQKEIPGNCPAWTLAMWGPSSKRPAVCTQRREASEETNSVVTLIYEFYQELWEIPIIYVNIRFFFLSDYFTLTLCRSIHISTNNTFFFLLPLYIFHCTYYHMFSIHSSVNGYLGCFHVLIIVNSAAMNIGMHVSELCCSQDI